MAKTEAKCNLPNGIGIVNFVFVWLYSLALKKTRWTLIPVRLISSFQDAIVSAKTEAKCNLPNGIGIVKLMGRHAGFVAAHATLASGMVDLCLIPEVPVTLDGM